MESKPFVWKIVWMAMADEYGTTRCTVRSTNTNAID
jgi:hypothetical protein